MEKLLSSRHIHSDACENLIFMEGEPRFVLCRIADLRGTVLSSSEIEGGCREMGLKTPLCADMVVVYMVGCRYCKAGNDNPG